MPRIDQGRIEPFATIGTTVQSVQMRCTISYRCFLGKKPWLQVSCKASISRGVRGVPSAAHQRLPRGGIHKDYHPTLYSNQFCGLSTPSECRSLGTLQWCIPNFQSGVGSKLVSQRSPGTGRGCVSFELVIITTCFVGRAKG